MQWLSMQLCPAAHTIPQPPQWLESVIVLTSQPSLSVPLQSAR